MGGRLVNEKCTEIIATDPAARPRSQRRPSSAYSIISPFQSRKPQGCSLALFHLSLLFLRPRPLLRSTRGLQGRNLFFPLLPALDAGRLPVSHFRPLDKAPIVRLFCGHREMFSLTFICQAPASSVREKPFIFTFFRFFLISSSATRDIVLFVHAQGKRPRWLCQFPLFFVLACRPFQAFVTHVTFAQNPSSVRGHVFLLSLLLLTTRAVARGYALLRSIQRLRANLCTLGEALFEW